MSEQLVLFSAVESRPTLTSACPSPAAGSQALTLDVGCAEVHAPGWTTTGICCGSPTCLCGQLELSDSPLWIENE